MTNETAFRTSDPEAIAAFRRWQTSTILIHRRRDLLAERLGRAIYVNRTGFGVGTRITGFERFPSDVDGALLADDTLIVSVLTGVNNGLIVPNRRRKAGRDFAVTLRDYDTPDCHLPGMPDFHVGGGALSLAVYCPHLWIWDDGDGNPALFAYWSTSTVEPEVGEQWERIPLSVYHLAHEQREASLNQTSLKVSGNEERA